MAKVGLILDTRTKSRSKRTDLYPIVLKVSHQTVKMPRTGDYTSKEGWDSIKGQFKKSALANRNLDCNSINAELDRKLYLAKELLHEIGESIHSTTVESLVCHIKEKWDYNPNSEIKKKVENEIFLYEWGNVIINRKLNSNEPGTAQWVSSSLNAIKRFNNGNDIKLYDVTVTFLKNFEAHHLGLGNSKSTISSYLRAVRSVYNSAIKEDQFTPIKHVFEHYKIPSANRTKKRAIAKADLLKLKKLNYEPFGALWNARNYALIMFYCRGMNFIDLVKIKVGDINSGRLQYGRSKTEMPLSVKITEDLQAILDNYLPGKVSADYLFPANYDGSTEHFQKYISQRRRMNERLRIIAKDAEIDAKLTTYTIRHTWATIAKYMGISTALISEGLGHHSIKTTEIYLKDFHNQALDEMNALVIA